MRDVSVRQELELLIDRMVAAGGACTESFFIEQGLGQAYASAGKYDGIRKHVNKALIEAERRDQLDELVAAAHARFGITSRSSGMASHGDYSSTSGIVFVSHASIDRDLAERVVSLLRLGTDLSSEQVLCTSLDGMGAPPDTPNYMDYLRDELSGARLVLPLLTPAFFDSEMCLVELGALWALESKRYILIVPPITYERIEGLLGKVQCAMIDKPSDLHDLRDLVTNLFKLSASTSLWNSTYSSFKDGLPEILRELAAPKKVPTVEYQKIEQRFKDSEATASALRLQLRERERQIAELRALKDRNDAAEILRPTDAQERFEQSVALARDLMAQLSPTLRVAVYECYGRNEYFRPALGNDDPIDEADEAVRNDQLIYYEDDGGYDLNRADPEISDVVNALDELFSVEWPAELLSEFERANRTKFKGQNKKAWEKLGIL